jgi:hypothetical protein
MANIGPLAIFSHLAQSSKLPFVIDNSFVHALEIATRILKQDPLIDHDLVSIASAPAASLIASGKLHDYVPLMFLPVARQQLVRARSVGRKRQQSLCGGTISLLHAEPSTVSFCFESLVENSTIKERNFSKLHHQPWETAELLASGDPEVLSLLFFPYAELHQWAQIAELVPALSSEARTAEVILFAKREFLADRARFFATVAAIRGAWASLRDCSASQKAAISGFVNRANYAKNMFRASGLDVTSASALAPEAYLS